MHLLLPLLRLYLAAALLTPAVTASHHVCSPPPPPSDDQEQPHPSSCPPFQSPPTSFPFASSPGCGHPSFQIRCSSPHSLISINSHPFLLLGHRPPNSLLLSPSIPSSVATATTTSAADACPSLPTAPIDLSGSPFRLSPDLCPLLSSLRPCRRSTTNSSSCPHLTPWQRRLLSRPLLLFTACPPARPAPRLLPRCHPDTTGSITTLLHSGIRLHWDPATDPYFSNCSSCQSATGGVCGFNDSAPSKPFLCFPAPDHLEHRSHPNAPAARVIVLISTLFAVACFLLIPLSLWAAAALRRCRDGTTAGDTTAAFLSRHQLRPPVYTYDQLSSCTNGFDPRRKIGDGGFGSVYLAQLDDGRVAAVKRLHRRHPAATTRSFCNEILILSSLRHPNLVRLHGYCCDPRGLLLVYDYVPNGTLADHLHGSRRPYSHAALTWPVRVDVAVQTAAALEYLHFALKPPVVHRDITSSNIFVERDMRIKVGDFGLSRLLSLPDPSSTGSAVASAGEYVCCTGPQGTPGYLDPDYHRSFRLTEKSDVYSFGVVLLELITGMKAVDLKREKRDVGLADMVVSKIQVGELHQVVDPALVRPVEEPAVTATIEAVAELAFRCVAGDKDDRPDSRELAEELRRIRGQIPDPPKGS